MILSAGGDRGGTAWAGHHPAGPATSAPAPHRLLVFTRTTGFRHDSIEAGIRALREIGARDGLAVEPTEDPDRFAPRHLAGYRAVVFLNTSGTVLDGAQRDAFESYIRAGGGFVGVHGAADTEYDWPFYGLLVGAYFASHPRVQPAAIQVVDAEHPATSHLPALWRRTDEWYDFRAPPRPGTRLLLTLDEASYEGGVTGPGHPHAWCHDLAGGRAFYTAGGHTIESYTELEFLAHLRGGIRYAAAWGA